MKNRRHFVRAFADGKVRRDMHAGILPSSSSSHLKHTYKLPYRLQAVYMSSTDEAPYRSHVVHDTTRPADLSIPTAAHLSFQIQYM